jgi:hypothetical protein
MSRSKGLTSPEMVSFNISSLENSREDFCCACKDTKAIMPTSMKAALRAKMKIGL